MIWTESPAGDVDVLGALGPAAPPALIVDEHYQVVAVNAAYGARFASLRHRGQRCFELVHGCPHPCSVNGEICPLLCARRTQQTCRIVHIHATAAGDRHTSVRVQPVDGPGNGRRFLFLVHEVEQVAAEPHARRLVGRSAAFTAMVAHLERVASASVPTVFVGEPGTGKSLAAQTLHAMGPRRLGPFVTVECRHCGQELFGSTLRPDAKHVAGLVDAARGGTLFLHGVEHLPRAVQGSILRLIESGTYVTANESMVVDADVRVVGTAYRPIGHLMDGAVRKDLADALDVYPIWVPPLRKRVDDIPLLVKSLLLRLPADERARTVSDRALSALQDYTYPGNVRELAGMIERASLLADAGVIEPEHLPSAVFDHPTETAARSATHRSSG